MNNVSFLIPEILAKNLIDNDDGTVTIVQDSSNKTFIIHLCIFLVLLFGSVTAWYYVGKNWHSIISIEEKTDKWNTMTLSERFEYRNNNPDENFYPMLHKIEVILITSICLIGTFCLLFLGAKFVIKTSDYLILDRLKYSVILKNKILKKRIIKYNANELIPTSVHESDGPDFAGFHYNFELRRHISTKIKTGHKSKSFQKSKRVFAVILDKGDESKISDSMVSFYMNYFLSDEQKIWLKKRLMSIDKKKNQNDSDDTFEVGIPD